MNQRRSITGPLRSILKKESSPFIDDDKTSSRTDVSEKTSKVTFNPEIDYSSDHSPFNEESDNDSHIFSFFEGGDLSASLAEDDVLAALGKYVTVVLDSEGKQATVTFKNRGDRISVDLWLPLREFISKNESNIALVASAWQEVCSKRSKLPTKSDEKSKGDVRALVEAAVSGQK